MMPRDGQPQLLGDECQPLQPDSTLLGFASHLLGKGFQFSALLSQRWRDGAIDIPGVWYEKNITLRQEYYGGITIGAFPARGWSVADYPYGSNVGLADAWGSSGSGYGAWPMRFATVPQYKIISAENFAGRSVMTMEMRATRPQVVFGNFTVNMLKVI